MVRRPGFLLGLFRAGAAVLASATPAYAAAPSVILVYEGGLTTPVVLPVGAKLP